MLTYAECPRDAWQGLDRVIPTAEKVAYLQALLDAGFRYLDMGSFVSKKAVPQLADTEEVLAQLEPPTGAELLCIIANERGLTRALQAENVTRVGYPFSVNDTFQRRNTKRAVADSWPLIKEMLAGASEAGLGLVVYLSMGFGNPYGEPWEPADTAHIAERLRELGVDKLVLADTVGTATPEILAEVLAAVGEPERLGLHLHARPDDWQAKVRAGLDAGVRWLEGAMGGLGGCPFAGNALVGNLPTEELLPFLAERFEVDSRVLAALPELQRRSVAVSESVGSGQ